MTSDLIFPILPREGKVPMAQDEQKVHRVMKEANMRRLNDEEKELNAEEREAREKYQPKDKKGQPKTAQPPPEKSSDAPDQDVTPGQKRLDIYV